LYCYRVDLAFLRLLLPESKTARLWTGEIVATILNFSPTWRDLMVRLVNAWGYAG
jgi:hypothetical protein